MHINIKFEKIKIKVYQHLVGKSTYIISILNVYEFF